MTTPEKLERIKEACREAIRLGEAATDGPWKCEYFGYHGKVDIRSNFGWPVALCASANRSETDCEITAAFIAHARTFSPMAAKMLLIAIEEIEKGFQGFVDYGALGRIAIEWPEVKA